MDLLKLHDEFVLLANQVLLVLCIPFYKLCQTKIANCKGAINIWHIGRLDLVYIRCKKSWQH